MTDGEFIVKRYRSDPVRYVREVIGAEPDDWQAQALQSVVDGRRLAIASGHGVGKTAYISWLVHWFMATRPNPQVVVTANTRPQLVTKTWRELAKWNSKAKNGGWFDQNQDKFWLKDAPATWFASALAWTEHRSEAFAGTHEDHVLYVFDEASAIADVIWDVSEGAMTTSGARWVVVGNPTRNTGRFRECFGSRSHRWQTMRVDSRTAKMADQAHIASWIDDEGEDSDFVRVRVRGEFPRAGSSQFIGSDLVEAAKARQVEAVGPVVFGVDVARFGDDRSAVVVRQGAKIIHMEAWRELDTMQTASRIHAMMLDHKPAKVFIDSVGVGGGVCDRLRQLHKGKIVDVSAGAKPDDPNRYKIKRDEMWGRVKDWLKQGSIPADRELDEDLTGIEYSYDPANRLILERKELMKRRGLRSPDYGDALAHTFHDLLVAVEEDEEEGYIGVDSWM